MNALHYTFCDMGSHRARRRPPADPPESQALQVVQNQPAVVEPPEPESDSRATPPPPSGLPPTPATPRYPGITEDNITPKHPDFLKKLDVFMTSRYHATTVATLLALVPGPNVPARDLQKMGTFRGYKASGKGKETSMYPPLVRHQLSSPSELYINIT